MMPDLGKYAFAVLASYGVSLALISALVAVSLRRSRRVRAELEKIEQRVKRHG
ncbi:heme exporter protein CcmD [Alloyangia pacifica]|uniref:Heme exporter protein D n=1 Tax=Alloyangia pacifica TaxID=311180 RepID=A0A2U8HBE5_9RHOB|nr:heme exporter protein CcmD [Alloyangia pacifica]AWI83269.1 heme exporter protein CcmD [Alloyangia pacifica]